MALNPEIGRSFSLAGRTAVITGAASGIGREAARIFALAGAQVVLADVDAQGLLQTMDLIATPTGTHGGGVRIVHTDVAIRDEVEALADEAVRACGAIDIWVNSAGISIWSEVREMDPVAAERLVAINMMGALWGCAAAGRAMRNRGGAIINVSSTAGDSAVPGLAVYGMAKAGLNQLTRVCAREFGADGIRVNAVVPGWIDTPINARTYRDADGQIDEKKRAAVLEQMAALSPLGITGGAVDIGMALLFLASEASRFVTGHLLRVSGGV